MLKKTFLRAMALSLAMILLMTSSGLALTLRYPQRGEDVASLQTALKQLGYYSKTVDGNYGSGTLAAVRAFQKAYGLSVDGVAGPKTLEKLEDLTGIQIGGGSTGGSGSTGSTPTTPAKGLFGGVYTTLQYGAEGERVRILQRALLALGYDVKVDGDFGSTTYVAVKEFQKAAKLSVDGKAGKQTLQKLESYFDENGNLLDGPIVTKPPVTEDTDGPAYDTPTRTLRYGMTGEDVRFTQQRLYTLGYYKGTQDGKFGSGMLEAVKAFQRRNDLTADGVIGSGTRKVLFSTDAIGAEDALPETDRTLRIGMEGEDVAKLQLRLKELGYYTGQADGEFGSGTYNAVRAFQKKNGLTADGVCGPTTAKAIYADDAIGANGSVVTPDVQPPVEDPVDPPAVDPVDPPVEEEPDDPPVSEPTPAPIGSLKFGDQGDEVKELQRRLKELGYYTNKIDGVYGSGTYSAVKKFQTRNGLTVDGKVGAKTIERLYAKDAIGATDATPTPPADEPTDEQTPTPTPAVTPSRTLRLGSSGEDVKLLQARLIELGYLKGTPDGDFGTTTYNAVKAFQQVNGLTTDGVAGQQTYRKLFSEAALKPTPTPGVGDTSIIPTRALVNGDTGEDVKSVQQRLKDLGYLSTVDGTYGSGTAAAMTAFQQMNSLTATGEGNTATYARLYSDDAINAKGVVNGQSVPAYRNLTIGATGTAVIRLQQTLAAYKYTVTVTGRFDEQTYQAVLAFQRRNDLDADGVAGKGTQTKLYSGDVVTGDTVLPDENTGVTGNGGGPAISQVKLLHWYDDMKGKLIKNGNILLVYEPSSQSSYYVKVFAHDQHADVEPLTKEDVDIMVAAWGGQRVWDEKPVYVRLANGTWCIASTFSKNHESDFITDNDFVGHVCIHFPRTMTEVMLNAPYNGKRHQEDIRKHWLAITGQEIPW